MKNKILVAMFISAIILPTVAFAQISSNPTASSFQLVWCDGPDLSSQPDLLVTTEMKLGHDYIPCNFTGALGQTQHLINIAIALGVFVAIAGAIYAGFLYVSVAFTGKEDNIGKAKDIFKKMLIGLVIMLCAWFIVYQITTWLTKDKTNSSATVLLGK